MSLALRALAGGLKGAGQYLTTEHERKEKRKGEELRQAYEERRHRELLASREATAQIGADATMGAAQLRSDTALETAEIGAASNKEVAEIRAGTVDRRTEADTKREKDDDAEVLIEQLSTEEMRDEEGNPTGEVGVNKAVSQALRAGYKKFGEVPPLEDVAIYLRSSETQSKRQWPSEMEFSWNDIRESVAVEYTSYEQVYNAMLEVRDELESRGIKVPQDAPPQEMMPNQRVEAPAPTTSAPQQPDVSAPAAGAGADTPSGPQGGAPVRSHLQSRIKQRMNR